MARPYSMDLRERVVAAVINEGMSCHAAAARFGVAASSAIKWVQRVRETGSAAPRRMGGRRTRILSGPHRDWLLERTATSRCAVWWPSWRSAGSGSTMFRSGASSTPRG